MSEIANSSLLGTRIPNSTRGIGDFLDCGKLKIPALEKIFEVAIDFQRLAFI